MNYRRLVAILFTVTSLSAQAEQRWFEVELLLFQRNVDIQNINEHLSSEQIVVDTSNSIELLKASKSLLCLEGESCLSRANPTVISATEFSTEDNNFVQLASSQLQLTDQRLKLEQHANFKPLLHMAWRMPMVSGRIAKPLHIFAGKNLALDMQKNNQPAQLAVPLTEQTNESTSSNYVAQETIDSGANNTLKDKWTIDGNFKIYLDHYLFIDSQLIIRKEVTEKIKPIEQAVELIDGDNDVQIAKHIKKGTENKPINELKTHTVIKEVLFDQNRRLRSGEIHYLDHPLIGIIVQIRKIPKTEQAQLQVPTL